MDYKGRPLQADAELSSKYYCIVEANSAKVGRKERRRSPSGARARRAVTSKAQSLFAEAEQPVPTYADPCRRKATDRNGTPLGYGVDHEQRLVVLPPEAGLVREIFQHYLACDSSADLMDWFERHGIKTKKWVTRDGKQRGGRPMDRTTLFRILNNRMYIGEALFDGEWHSRIYPPIIALDLWRDVQEKLNRRARRKDVPNEGRSPLEFPLYDKLFWHEGQAYTASKSSLRGKQRYRYYLAPNAAKKPEATGGADNLPTEFIHQVVIAQLRQHFKSPEPWLADLREQMKSDVVMDDEAIRQSMLRLDGSWRLFTDFGMANLLFKLVARVTMYPDGAKIQINMDALAGLIKEIGKAREDAGNP